MPNFEFEVSGFSCTKWWNEQIATAVATGAWLILQNMCQDVFGDAFSWGISLAVVGIAFGSNVNALCQFSKWIKGGNKLSDFVYALVFQAIGASLASCLSSNLGLSASLSFDNSASFDGAFGENLFSFWFSKEVLAIYFFCKFSNNMKFNGDDMPDSVKNMFLIALAFMIGGSGIAFFPGHMWASGFSAFSSASTWVLLFQQMWAVFLANTCDKVCAMW